MNISDKYNLVSLANAIYDTGVNLAERRLDWLALMYSMAGGGESLRASFHKLASQGSTYKFRENDREFTKAIKKTSDENLAWLLKKAKELGINLEDYRTYPNPPSKGGSSTAKRMKIETAYKTPLHTPNDTQRNPLPLREGWGGSLNFIPNEYLAKCRSNNSSFVQSLVSAGILTPEQAACAADLYHLGAMRDGSVIYWQIDTEGRVRDGKVMQYGADCHRLKDHGAQWMGWLMRYRLKGADGKFLLPQDWQSTQSLFGLHQMKEKGDGKSGNLICLVEAEKTAVIMSQLRPGPIWLASGGEGQLTLDKLAPLLGHKVILFPDTDPDGKTFQTWQNIANEARRQLGLDISISDLLEDFATPEEKSRKIDIADFLIENRDDSNEVPQKEESPQPSAAHSDDSVIQELIDTFDLVEISHE